MDEILENIKDNTPVKVPQVVKTLAIFSHIGNAFWGIVILVIFFWALGSPASFKDTFNLTVEAKTAFIVGVLLLISIIIICIIGVVQMTRGKKSGFWMYLITNGLWVIVGFLAATPQNITVAAISLGFIFGFASQLKNLR